MLFGLLLLSGCTTLLYQTTEWAEDPVEQEAKAGIFAYQYQTVFNGVIDTLERNGKKIRDKRVTDGIIMSEESNIKGLLAGYVIADVRDRGNGKTQVKWSIRSKSFSELNKSIVGTDQDSLTTKPAEVQNANEYWNKELLKTLRGK